MPPGVVFEAPTIEALARRISGGATRDPGLALVALRAEGSGSPLYLMHQMGGDLVLYRHLVEHLGAGRPVYGLQAPGLEDFATPVDRIEALAARYVGEIRALQPRGPYALAGHSAGGLIAYEMAQQLRAAGDCVALLALLDTDADLRVRPTRLDRLRYFAHAVRTLDQRQRLAYVSGMLGRRVASLCGTLTPARTRPPAPAPAEDGDPVRAAMERAVLGYRPLPYRGSVTLFRATRRGVSGNRSRTLGWRRLAQGGIRVVDVPGEHLTMLRRGRALALAAALDASLEAAFGTP
jgi:thioesterase domain-containing protein